jgi:hypothetical protein
MYLFSWSHYHEVITITASGFTSRDADRPRDPLPSSIELSDRSDSVPMNVALVPNWKARKMSRRSICNGRYPQMVVRHLLCLHRFIDFELMFKRLCASGPSAFYLHGGLDGRDD